MKKNGLYFSFIGASGSGKSTLLKYIAEKYQIETKEVSARKLLDPTKGSYNEQMCDELETKINFYYLQETFRNILLAREGHNIITTRCVIDSLAYTHSLKAAEFLIPQIEEAVELIKDEVIILYTLCDFPMAQAEDKLRGMNEKIRQETDQEFLNLIEKLNIPHYTINGSLEERKHKLDILMKKYHIKKKYGEDDS
jgi:nicotinamide riboside kinase